MIGYGAKSFRIAARPVAERSRVIRMKCSLLRRRQRFSRPTINPRDRSTKGKRRSTGLADAGTVGGADDERAAARDRVKFYKARGYEVRYFDLSER